MREAAVGQIINALTNSVTIILETLILNANNC